MNYLKAKQAILALSAIGISASSITSCNKEKANVVAPIGDVNNNSPSYKISGKPYLTDNSFNDFLIQIANNEKQLDGFISEIKKLGLSTAIKNHFEVSPIRDSVTKYIFEPKFTNQILESLIKIKELKSQGILFSDISTIGLDNEGTPLPPELSKASIEFGVDKDGKYYIKVTFGCCDGQPKEPEKLDTNKQAANP